MLLCWSTKLNWIPRKPTFMFTICQNGNRGRFVILSFARHAGARPRVGNGGVAISPGFPRVDESEQSVGRQRNAAVPRSLEARAVVSPDRVHELVIHFDGREVVTEHEVAAIDDVRGRNRMTDSDG